MDPGVGRGEGHVRVGLIKAPGIARGQSCAREPAMLAPWWCRDIPGQAAGVPQEGTLQGPDPAVVELTLELPGRAHARFWVRGLCRGPVPLLTRPPLERPLPSSRILATAFFT